MSDHINVKVDPHKYNVTLCIPNPQSIINPIKNMILSMYNKYFNTETVKKVITYYMSIAYVLFLLISIAHSIRAGFMYDEGSYCNSHCQFYEIERLYANNFKNHVLIALKWPWGALSYLITNLASIITMRKITTCYNQAR